MSAPTLCSRCGRLNEIDLRSCTSIDSMRSERCYCRGAACNQRMTPAICCDSDSTDTRRSFNSYFISTSSSKELICCMHRIVPFYLYYDYIMSIISFHVRHFMCKHVVWGMFHFTLSPHCRVHYAP